MFPTATPRHCLLQICFAALTVSHLFSTGDSAGCIFKLVLLLTFSYRRALFVVCFYLEWLLDCKALSVPILETFFPPLFCYGQTFCRELFLGTAVDDDAPLGAEAVIINNLEIALHLSLFTECRTSQGDNDTPWRLINVPCVITGTQAPVHSGGNEEKCRGEDREPKRRIKKDAVPAKGGPNGQTGSRNATTKSLKFFFLPLSPTASSHLLLQPFC